MKITFDWDEVDSLITLLRAKGISYLMGNGSSLSKDDGRENPVHLIQRLAACGYPLVENASISLFILHLSGYGLHGLLALQEHQRQRYGVSLNFLDDWQNQINHLLAQEEAYRRELPSGLREALVQLSI